MQRQAHADRRQQRSAVSARIRLGVPPPMKMLPTGRFQICGRAASRSAISAAR
jgi:hypothetical protein